MDSGHVAAADHAAPQTSVPEDPHFGKASGGKVGMWIFIAQDGMSFGGLLFAYGILRATATEWPVPSDILGIALTAIATFILICSSLSMVFAVEAAEKRDQVGLVRWLMVTIAGGLLFLGVQVWEYMHLVHAGIGFAECTWEGETVNSLFGSTFYAVTGFHGMHVTAGVIYLMCILRGAMKGKYTQGGTSSSPVELVGLFWHFVDLVWILVFTFIYLL
ncbi:MAG: cytochrome c oxidase subunit 3 [Planctomycetota bacterium]|jgi:heme/copper-type cytochrome/quinol oxidase subunit 3|nr:cytochrome c oxidase subunit 3 [Planctomycetota bacterium]